VRQNLAVCKGSDAAKCMIIMGFHKTSFVFAKSPARFLVTLASSLGLQYSKSLNI
jgi:hypothetical protein